MQTCFLDAEKTVAAPDIYAYDGVPEDMPQPALGSRELLKIRDDVCFDRFGRYGPYGLGYGKDLGGIGPSNETESSSSKHRHFRAESGLIDYRRVDWDAAQKRCYDANKAQPPTTTAQSPAPDTTRTAIVIRGYEGFAWTPMAILNVRAMVTELSLKTGGAYAVHLLMQVKDAAFPLSAPPPAAVRAAYLNAHVPAEFHGLVTLWSEHQMRQLYAGDYSTGFRNPTGRDVHDVYRSPHLALQSFARAHPEYRHFWNWELDVRVLGSYYEMLARIGAWADARPRALLWALSERYYVPRHHHRSWDNFTRAVRQQEAARDQPPPGPIDAPWRTRLSSEEAGGSASVLPPACLDDRDGVSCGVGEAADLVTLSPLFDVARSGWFFAHDVTGYDRSLWTALPRRAAIVTAGRYSRRLLLAMDEEVGRHNRSMFAEMFPATVALHHGFKAVYAPHPVHLSRAWAPADVDRHYNSGERHSTSGRRGPFSLATERVHAVSSWYYKSRFSQHLWQRWLGHGGSDGESEAGGGPMCLQSMLLHPIKQEHPSE